MLGDKIKTRSEIGEIAAELKRKGRIIVTTNGSFDILHYGHIDLLEKARQEGDVLVVLLNSDNSVKLLKGPDRPIIPERERAIMLAALASVDYVVIFNENTPLELLEAIKPNKHIKGGSFITERIEKEEELLKNWNGEFKNFKLEENFSTTNIINKILDMYQ